MAVYCDPTLTKVKTSKVVATNGLVEVNVNDELVMY